MYRENGERNIEKRNINRQESTRQVFAGGRIDEE